MLAAAAAAISFPLGAFWLVAPADADLLLGLALARELGRRGLLLDGHGLLAEDYLHVRGARHVGCVLWGVDGWMDGWMGGWVGSIISMLMTRRGPADEAKTRERLTVDAAVRAVRPPPLLGRAVSLGVVDVESLGVQALHLW